MYRIIIFTNENIAAQQNRLVSEVIHHKETKKRVSELAKSHGQRKSAFSERQIIQKEALKLLLYPTTTIGSF